MVKFASSFSLLISSLDEKESSSKLPSSSSLTYFDCYLREELIMLP